MAVNELERLRTLAQFAEQVCTLADTEDEARKRINHFIARAEDDIRTKSLEIQMQQSHIALLKQLDGFMTRPAAEPAAQVRLNTAGPAGPRAISGDAS